MAKKNKEVLVEEKGRPIIPPRPDNADKYKPMTLDERIADDKATPKVVNIVINL